MGFLKEPSHVLLLLVVVLVLFGGRRLPDAARGLGRSMRIFKSEIKQMQDDDAPRQPANPDAPSRAESSAAEPTRGDPSRTTPLEGRVVPGEPASARAEHRSDT
jgi:sec-independent protein translocase protein TatA